MRSPFDLRALARRAVLEAGFVPDVPPDARREAEARPAPTPAAAAAAGARDLRDLLWSSVDNEDSRDLDQVEVAEALPEGDIRLRVGIADVDALAPAGLAVDRHAAENTTSVYTGVETFPMLPLRLSHDLTSLLEGADRLAVVVDLVVEPDGTVSASALYRALVRNQARLVYESIGPWLEGRAPVPAAVARVPGLEAQLRLQDEATGRFQALRRQQGALDLETVEASPVVADGRVVDLVVKEKSRSRSLVENFMVAVNGATAAFLAERGLPAIQRVVRVPKRWSRIVDLAAGLGERLPPDPDPRALAAFLSRRRQADPAGFPDLSLSVVKLLGAGEYLLVRGGAPPVGHFGLAVQGYTHSTAPNRRYCDLVTQRLVKAALAEQAVPYSEDALAVIAARCTQRAAAAAKVERRMRKAAAAVLLADRVGERFEAIITGASEKGTYARLFSPPAEGRVVRGEEGLDVGDRVTVRLVATNPEAGFIDFARAA
jgi:exoribonuclease-2